ncbi:hypothetical protein Taro_006520 [Colocasia esculenta]|uniref:Uncharacterized protein n=1 Tax=Colocasia esculenta TaxID=4460 RepID=A0A843TNZ9_COLES|nr:hypothetical protein [Colocasia esculenta]
MKVQMADECPVGTLTEVREKVRKSAEALKRVPEKNSVRGKRRKTTGESEREFEREFLVAGEQEIVHTKPFFFPVVSATTCTDGHLEVDQRRRPCECDGPKGRVLRSCRDSTPVAF